MEQVKNYKDGFNKGYMQLKLKDKNEAKQEIWDALGINNRNSFYQYLYGKIECRASQAESVERIFSKYGIKDIWGE
jgi:hypothetical protein